MFDLTNKSLGLCYCSTVQRGRMTDEELEQAADQLGDMQQLIAYVLFRRGHPSLRNGTERELLSRCAERLRVVAARFDPSPQKPSAEDIRDAQVVARRAKRTRSTCV
jgi:hypothetical protein